jgi:hypothetical protein
VSRRWSTISHGRVSPDQGTTSGSQSTPTNVNEANLAQACAPAVGAALVSVDEGSLRDLPGVVTTPPERACARCRSRPNV